MKAKTRVRSQPQHGTYNEYNNYGCRCEPCKAAAAQANAEGRERLIERGYFGWCACGAPLRHQGTEAECVECFRARIAAKHGTESRYNNGCRCGPCVYVANAARADRRRDAQPAVHGTHTSYSNGCRCDECRAANTKYAREYRRAKAVAA